MVKNMSSKDDSGTGSFGGVERRGAKLAPDGRPDPDTLLARLRVEEEELDAKGHLKIFLGYAAGVGKTYAMLCAAGREASAGRKVLVGLVETHDRPETRKLLESLEVLPRRRVKHREVALEEFDLDACLQRRPELALVDELAHSNAPGSRHHKRFQDVEELLEAGIDVYTTLNIQHVESLNDVVEQITGVRVRETLPDSVLERADSLALIDIPPEELLERLRQGNVYLGDKAGRAAQNFFRPGNLAALREMALRSAADQVDDDVRSYMRKRSIQGPWPVRDRLLVSVGPSPLSERLVRAARRLADSLDAEWLAVTVEGAEPLQPVARDRVAAHMRLAETLGATTARITGVSIAEAVMNYARQQNVTKIVAGKPLRSSWRQWFHGDLVDRLIRQSGNIDVYVISGEASAGAPIPPLPARRVGWNRYFKAALAVLATTALGLLVRGRLAPTNLVMLYLGAVTGVAYQYGRGPGVLASTLGVALFDYVFVHPYYTMAVTDSEYFITFAGFLAIALVISGLTARAREQAAAACDREEQTVALLDLSRELSYTRGEEGICAAVARHLERHLKLKTVVWVNNRRSMQEVGLSESHRAVALWAEQHARPAGHGTDTLPEADFLCYPIVSATSHEVLALLGVPASPLLTIENRRLLEAFARQSALAMERARLASQAHEAEVLKATEALQTALLNSISHDLRIPLVSITGALTALQEDERQPDKQSLLENAISEADRLNRIVGNLLQITRIDAGAVKLNRQPHELHDLVVTTLRDWRSCRVELDLTQDLPLVEVDYVLIQQVLTNLLDNAQKFTPPGQPIVIGGRRAGEKFVEVRVTDKGPGIPETDREAVFERFYRVQHGNQSGGTGLGLSICKGLVEAHGGRIWVETASPGASLHFLLEVADERSSR